MTKEDYLIYLVKRRCTITSQRKILINYFYDNRENVVSAKRIISDLKRTNKKISFDTIYKNLNLFVTIQVIGYKKIKGTKYFYLR
ncbi:transcriptional repressor [Priestia megaterium]